MLIPPDVSKSEPAVPHAPRSRSWAARLVLLVACAGSVATSQAPRYAVATAEYVGPTLLLNAEYPAQTRTLVAQVSTEEASSDRAEVHAALEITATWKPRDPARQDKPRLRLRFPDLEARQPRPGPSDGGSGDGGSGDGGSGDGGSGDGGNLGIAIDSPMQHVDLYSTTPDCSLDKACELPFPFMLEIVPGSSSAPGSFEVQWKVTADATLWYSTQKEPKGFTLQLTER